MIKEAFKNKQKTNKCLLFKGLFSFCFKSHFDKPAITGDGSASK